MPLRLFFSQMALKLPTFTTPASEELCKEIARKSNGTIFLGFSRGKDSLCAWLQCKKYFHTIIPVHCASYPGLKHTEAALKYYEKAMTDDPIRKPVHILRMVGEELQMALRRGMYQTAEDLEEIEELDGEDYSKLDVLEELRYVFNLPRAWCAFGISMSDSIDRRIYIKKTGGKNEDHKSFYPCLDWPRAEILRAVRESGVKLSGEYRWASRTLGGVPSATCNRIYKAHYPEDWERIQAMYPLCWAKTLREKYLDLAFERRKAMGIVADDSDEDAEAEESAADLMPEMGIDGVRDGDEE